MKTFGKILAVLLLLLLALVIYIWSAGISDPNYDLSPYQNLEKVSNDDVLSYTDGGWFQRNDQGLYELYVEGDPLALGYKRGLLSEDLIHKQEKLFIERILELVPSKNYLRVLKELIAWFNSDLPDYIEDEYLREIYGVSRFASDEFDFVGSKYERILNYHAAHDIGHALENYNLVGCTSFSTWNPDGSNLWIGRNFDFSMGEAFAENKIICFYRPEQGIPFAMIAWSDFIGSVSGMNLEGLTVTINAGENDIPKEVGTPISIIAREILQYASNVKEAMDIARKRKSYVSESFLIGSSNDGYTAIIEKTPDTTILIIPEAHRIICSNHFLSDALKSTPDNRILSASRYRYKTLENELGNLDSSSQFTFARILRQQRGLNNADIGMGNEKLLNQLVAHHSIIFQPHERRLWISTPPYQLGPYLCYDLDSIFSADVPVRSGVNYISGESIPADPFLESINFKKYKEWKIFIEKLADASNEGKTIPLDEMRRFVEMNPSYFYTYEVVGDYYKSMGEKETAKSYYHEALEKELSNPSDWERIHASLNELEN